MSRKILAFLEENKEKIVTVPTMGAGHRDFLTGQGAGPDSTMGALADRYGLVMAGGGLLRLFGGQNSVCDDLESINRRSGPLAMLVAGDTAEGGIFALNGRKDRGLPLGEVLYLPPDSLCWEPLGICYGELVRWAVGTTREKLYEGGWAETPRGYTDLRASDRKLIARLELIRAMGGVPE